MKRILIVCAISALIYACGNNAGQEKATTPATDETTTETTSPTASDDLSSNPDYQKGLELIASHDCLTCHKVDEKNIGPSYREVAAKYEAGDSTLSMLADKIIHGGQGVWGTVPMTPHPDLSKADAEQMVKYVMLLKK